MALGVQCGELVAGMWIQPQDLLSGGVMGRGPEGNRTQPSWRDLLLTSVPTLGSSHPGFKAALAQKPQHRFNWRTFFVPSNTSLCLVPANIPSSRINTWNLHALRRCQSVPIASWLRWVGNWSQGCSGPFPMAEFLLPRSRGSFFPSWTLPRVQGACAFPQLVLHSPEGQGSCESLVGCELREVASFFRFGHG